MRRRASTAIASLLVVSSLVGSAPAEVEPRRRDLSMPLGAAGAPVETADDPATESGAFHVVVISDEGLDPSELDVAPGDVIEMRWSGEGAAVEVEASHVSDGREAGAPLFDGGDGDIYKVSSEGTRFTVSDAADGEYRVVRQSSIGGTVRGRINVKRT